MGINKLSEYRIVFLPDKYLLDLSKKLAHEISLRSDVFFRLDRKNFAHLTIYKVEFPTKNEKNFFKLLENFSKTLKPFKVHFKRFFSEEGWVELDFEKSAHIYSVHKKIVEMISPLREGYVREKYYEQMKDPHQFPGRQREYIETYGNPYVMSEYHPHLSLLRFKDVLVAENIQKQYNKKKMVIRGGTITGIAVATGNEHGTVNKFVRKYMFEK